MSKLYHRHFIAIGPTEEYHAELMSFLLHRRAMFPYIKFTDCQRTSACLTMYSQAKVY